MADLRKLNQCYKAKRTCEILLETLNNIHRDYPGLREISEEVAGNTAKNMNDEMKTALKIKQS